MIKQYRNKPVVIEAVQWTGDNHTEIFEFVGADNIYFTYFDEMFGTVVQFRIKTLEGDLEASIGDYIIKGVKGEFYPCKSDIFAATYEEVQT